MHLFAKTLCLLSISSSAFCLNLPKKTDNNTEFKPAAKELAADPDFKGKEGQEIYKEIAMEVRHDPKQADIKAVELANEPGRTAAEKRELAEYVATELKKEALARQYVLLIDNSGSMGSADPDGGTRWKAAENVTKQLIDAMFKYDMDHKVPVFLFGHEIVNVGEVSKPEHVMAIFKDHGPTGASTDLASALDASLKLHLGASRNNYEVVPGTTIVVITDGAPNSQSAVLETLRRYADPKNGLIKNDEELAISFIQVGDDSGAKSFLDGLDGGFMFDGRKLDICDTKKDDDVRKLGAEKILADAIFD